MILPANICNPNKPNIYIADTLGEIASIQSPKDGDISILIASGVTQMWVFDVDYDGETNDDAAIAGGCSGAWVLGMSSGSDNINVVALGADPTGTEDSYAAIQEGIDIVEARGGGVVFIPTGLYRVDTTLRISLSNVFIQGEGSSQFWGQGVTTSPVTIDYRGTGSALEIDPSGIYSQSHRVDGVRFDGTNATGNVDGLRLDVATAGDQEGYYVFSNCAFTNFPRHQVYQPAAGAGSACFGITFRDCNFHNMDRAADHVILFEGNVNRVSQITFDNCRIEAYTATKFGVKAEAASVRFFGGTLATVNNANGGWIQGGSSVYGLHAEGNSATDTNVGFRVAGLFGHHLSFADCSLFGYGVQVGDPTTPGNGVAGVVITGSVSGNNEGTAQSATLTSVSIVATATVVAHGYISGDNVLIAGANETDYNGTFVITRTGPNTFTYLMFASPGVPATGTITARLRARDIYVVAGGSRRGTIIQATGDADGLGVFVTNQRLVGDGIQEVITMNNDEIVSPVLHFQERLSAPAAPPINEVVIYSIDNGAGKTQLMARFATGAVQQLAIQP